MFIYQQSNIFFLVLFLMLPIILLWRPCFTTATLTSCLFFPKYFSHISKDSVIPQHWLFLFQGTDRHDPHGFDLRPDAEDTTVRVQAQAFDLAQHFCTDKKYKAFE